MEPYSSAVPNHWNKCQEVKTGNRIFYASADLIADAVNEALFDLIGDTVVEFGAAGPELVEDYREDVEELLAHE